MRLIYQYTTSILVYSRTFHYILNIKKSILIHDRVYTFMRSFRAWIDLVYPHKLLYVLLNTLCQYGTFTCRQNYSCK